MSLTGTSRDPAILHDLARFIRAEDGTDVLPLASRMAATFVGAHQAAAALCADDPTATVYLSPRYGLTEPWDAASGLGRVVAVAWQAERLTSEQLAADPRYRDLVVDASPALRDFIAAPIVDRDGRTRGRIALSDAVEGEFTDVHADLLEAVADTVSAAIDRRLLYEGLADAQRRRQAFFGIVSHELRTPITTIYGGIRMLDQAGARLSHDTREQLMDDISAESERLYRLVEDMLVLSRVERDALDVTAEPILLQHLLARVAASETHRRPGSRIEIEAGPELPPVMGDSTLVEQVVRDLLSNALSYAGAEGPIEVSASSTVGWVEVRVVDVGPGIDLDPPERAFELFVRAPGAPAREQGAGIGLYVCRELVRAMGGQLWVRRREPRGTEVGFRLRAYDVEGGAGAIDRVGSPT